MALAHESLGGGLVTARHPTQLQPGELTKCRNAVYEAHSEALHRPPGVTWFPNPSTSSIIGVQAVEFNNGERYILAYAGTDYFRSSDEFCTTPPTYWFSMKSAVVAGTTFTTTAFNDKFFLFNGAERNQVLRNDGTLRNMGMLPVTSTPAALTLSSGTWERAVGYYEYWVTEVARFTENGAEVELESGFTGTPKTVYVGATTNTSVRLWLPSPRNTTTPTTTHWRVYRSDMKATSSERLFPVGQLVATLPLGTDYFTDGQYSTLPSTPSPDDYYYPTAHIDDPGTKKWTNPVGAYAIGGTNAYCENMTTTTGRSSVVTYKTFKTPGGSYLIDTSVVPPVTGIEVGLYTYNEISPIGKATLEVALSRDGGLTFPYTKTVNLTTAWTAHALGGVNDDWGNDAWLPADFHPDNFQVRLQAFCLLSTVTVRVDYVRVRLFHNGTQAVELPTVYPSISLTINGVETACAEDGLPPVASTCCVFEGMTITNDAAHPTHIRASAPGKSESFPELYFVDMEFGTVKCVATVGNRLIVGLADQLWRVNNIPTEDDAIFNRGRVKDLISSDVGILGPHLAVPFTGPDGRALLAFVSHGGIYATDGFNAFCLSEDLDWPNTVRIASLTSAALINNAERFELVFYYNPTASSAAYTSEKIVLSYHPHHIKPTRLGGWKCKVSGPIATPNSSVSLNHCLTCACSIHTQAGPTRVFHGYHSGLVATDSALGAMCEGDCAPNIITRRLQPAGPCREWTADELYVEQNSTPPGNFKARALTTLTAAPETTGAWEPFVGASSRMTKLGIGPVTCEGLRVEVAGEPTSYTYAWLPPDWTLEYLVYNIPTQYGKEDAQ